MSSDFAEFLFSFACNKLESSPQLDLRQQLLHSNLIRHILLVHHQGPAPSSAPSPLSPSPTSPSPEEQPQLLSLPPLPPSPPPSPAPQHYVYPASPATSFDLPASTFQTFPAPSLVAAVPYQTLSHWSPFSFDDELDRIRHNNGPDQALVHDLDVDMDEDSADQDLSSLPQSLYISDLNGGSSAFDYSRSFRPSYVGVGPQLQEEDDDLDYDYESSQAQEDWLDAVLEDLMEEDEHDDSSVEYDSEDDSDSFGGDEDIGVTQAPPAVIVAVGSAKGEGEDVVLALPPGRHHRLSQPHRTHSSTSAPCSSPLSIPSQRPLDFSHPYHQSYLHQSFPSNEKGSTTNQPTSTKTTAVATTAAAAATAASATTTASAETTAATASRLLLTKGVDLDEPMHPHNHQVSSLKQQQMLQRQSYYVDDAYYRTCPPCLGFHCSSRSSSQREYALREQRFVQLRQELGSTLIQEQEAALTATPLSPEQQSLEDSLLFRSSALSQTGRQYPFVVLGH